MTSTLPPSASVRFIDAPIEHTNEEEGATQALVNSASRRAPGSSYHSELLSASLSYQLSSSPPLHLYDTEEENDHHQDHGAPGSRRYRRYLNTIVSDYESETDVEEEADPHIVRFEWKSDFIAVGDAFFQGGMSEQHLPRVSRSRRHRLPTISQDGDVILYGQEIAPYLYRRMDARVRPLLKKMPERDCHLITQLEHLICAFKNDTWRWNHRAQVDAARQAQRQVDRDAYHQRLQNMTLSSSPDTDSIASSPESSSSSSMVMGTPPSHAPVASTSPPSPIHRPRFTVSSYLSQHRPTAFTLLPSAPSSSHRDRRRTRHEARRRRKHHVDSDDDEDGYVMIDKDDGSDDETLCIVFQDSFQRFLGHGILHFHQLQSTSETIGRSSKQQRVTFITKPSFTSKSKPIYTHNASLLTHLQQLYTARIARQNVKQQPS